MTDASSDTPSDGQSAYRVLARKYRPARFEELVGQDAMVRTLSNAFETGRIAQGFMLTGVRGIGKTTTARLIARALNYSLADKPTVKMPEMGEHCAAILESRHVDVMEMDAASHTGVDNVREIIEQVRYRPVAARYKVYIIDEVHMLSKAAFNALLKTLEEPPEHVKFIFATTEIRKVPVTVLSRCQRFDLKRVEAATLMKHLAHVCEAEGVNCEEPALRQIARAAEGSVRDALSLLDQAMAHGAGEVKADGVAAMLGLVDRARVIDLFAAVMGGKMREALEGLAESHALGAEPLTILNDLAAFAHLVTRLKILGAEGADAAISEEERGRGLKLAEKLSMAALTRAWQMLLKGMGEVATAARPLPAAEMVLIRLAHAADMPPPGELVRKLRERDQEGAASGPSPAAPTGGGSARTQARATSEGRGMPPQPPAPGAQAATARKLARPQSFEEIVKLAGTHRDLKAKDALERHVRPVRVAPGVLEIALTKDAPRDLPADLGRKLRAWTGQRWLVTLSDEAGGETIMEREQRLRDSLMSRARTHPEVKRILEQFPDARIVDVRPLDAPRTPQDSEDET